MIIAIASGMPASLEEQDDFGSLRVTVGPDVVDNDVLQVLTATAADEPDHIWIPAEAIRAMASRTDEWDEAFEAMLVKVEPYGWYDSANDRVKAHVERADPEAPAVV